MIYYKYMYTYDIYPPAAGRFETSQLTQQSTKLSKNLGRLEKEKGKKWRRKWRRRNSLLSSRRVWPDSKFLRFASTLNEQMVDTIAYRKRASQGVYATRVRRGRDTCLSKSLLERRKVASRSSRGPNNPAPANPATFVHPRTLYHKPRSKKIHTQPPEKYNPYPLENEEHKKLEWKHTVKDIHPSGERKRRREAFPFSRQRRKTLPACVKLSDNASGRVTRNYSKDSRLRAGTQIDWRGQ